MQVLIIEADDRRAIEIGDYVSQQGDEPDFAADAGLALRLCELYRYDAVILEPDPPSLDGDRIQIDLRQRLPARAPIVVVGNEVVPETVGDGPPQLRAALPHIYARLDNTLRGSRGTKATIDLDMLQLDPEGERVHCGGETVELGTIGYRILDILMANRSRVVARAEIETNVWPTGTPRSKAALRGHIHRLRTLLEPVTGARLIRTVRGVGYQWVGVSRQSD